MAEVITTAIFATFSLPTSYTLTVSDDQGAGRSVTIGTLNTTTYWRVYCASSATPGTPSTDPAAPKSLLAHIQNKLNAGGSAIWALALNANGFVQHTYTGVVRAGTITFPDDVVRHVLGYIANVACTPYPGTGTSQGAYHPTHAFYSLGTADATNWIDMPPLAAVDEWPDGSTDGISSAAAGQTYTFDSRFHPYDWGTRTTLGIGSTASSATPYQGDSSRRKTRSTDAGVTPPYSCTDFRSTCALNNGTIGMAKCGALIGEFQNALTGSTTSYDEVFLSADTLTKDGAFKPSIANWKARMDWQRITLRHYAVTSF